MDHLLDKHAFVIVARAAVDTARAVVTHATQARDALGIYIPMDCPEQRAVSDAHDALASAGVARDAAEATLREALAHAPWGTQPDGSFVTRTSTRVASVEHVSTLHAPHRGGRLAVVEDTRETHSGHRLRDVYARASARTAERDGVGR
jgi:hypothetical protein